MNRTVQGVAAAICGMVSLSHNEFLPHVNFEKFDESYSVFENSKLFPSGCSPTIKDHLSVKPPDLPHVYKFIYSLFRRAQSFTQLF
jgi:hypothetical protein